jgi:O-antigen biosynthesis protein
VVIATTNDHHGLLRCLAALERGAAGVPYEVVLVLNGAEPKVIEAAHTVSGPRLVDSAWNLGFAGASNLGRAHCQGELIVLLHDDAEPEEGWLEALVSAARRHPEAGVIGSRVLSGDGLLELAGAAIFSDATTALRGRGSPPTEDEFMVSRPVDYCGSSSLLVRAETWDSVGGLDELMFPAGYVDVDLSIAARSAGWVVWYEAAAVVRHHAGGTMSSGFKVFAHERNRARLRAKWAPELELHEPPSPDLDGAVARAQIRAEARAAELGARPQRAVGSAAAPQVATEELGPRLAALELAMRREYVAIVDAELEGVRSELERQSQRAHQMETELVPLRERAATLDAVLAGGWWRLRRRVLPLISLARRLGAARRSPGTSSRHRSS